MAFHAKNFRRVTSILILLLSTTYQTKCQTIKNLVLEGGGIRGLAYPGALFELEKAGMLDSITRVAGTSSGGFNAALLSIGYSPEEMIEIVMALKVHRLNQRGIPLISPGVRMRKKFGWFSSQRLSNYIEELIKRRTSNKDLTFEQLHDSAIKYPDVYKDLFLTGTDLKSQNTVLFSYQTFPKMRIVDATRISMTIPLYFEAIFMDRSGKILNSKKEMDSTTMIMVDGGLGMNYPIHVFDTLVKGNPHSLFVPNPGTLGLKFETNEQIDYNIRGKGLAPMKIYKVTEFIGAFYNVSFEEINRSALSIKDWERTIFIPIDGISPRIKRLSMHEKQFLIKSGSDAVVRHINGQ